MKQKGIFLSIDSTVGAGAVWRASLSFIPNDKGFSVSYELDTSEDNRFPEKKADDVFAPLDLRQACGWLLKNCDEYGLYCDEPGSVDVQGVSKSEADILSLCWSINTGPYDKSVTSVIEFLIDLSVEDLEYLWEAHKSLRSEEALNVIKEFAEKIDFLELTDGGLKIMASEFGLSKLPPLKKFIKIIDEKGDGLLFQKKKEKSITHAMEAFRRQYLGASKSAEASLEKHLKSNDLPYGVVQVDGVGLVDIDHLFGRLEGFVRSQKEEFLDKEKLEACVNFDPSRDGPTLDRLILSWCKADVKPVLSTQSTGGFHLAKEASFVQWMLEGAMSHLVDFAEHYPCEYNHLTKWIEGVKDGAMSIPDSYPEQRSGRAALKRRWCDFAHKVLAYTKE